MIAYMDTYNDFMYWCAENGYCGEELFDVKEVPYKREVQVEGYIQKSDGTFASIGYMQHYDWGSNSYEVYEEGLIRTEEQVVTTKVVYKKQ